MSITIPVSKAAPALKRATEGQLDRIDPVLLVASLALLAIGLVMGVEGVNTAIEKLSDYVQPEHDPRIGRIKDISAGAVMIVSLLASIIGLIIYIPKIF